MHNLAPITHNLIVQDGDYRIVFYPAGGFSYQCKAHKIWVVNEHEPVTSPHLLASIQLWKPDYPIEYATAEN